MRLWRERRGAHVIALLLTLAWVPKARDGEQDNKSGAPTLELCQSMVPTCLKDNFWHKKLATKINPLKPIIPVKLIWMTLLFQQILCKFGVRYIDRPHRCIPHYPKGNPICTFVYLIAGVVAWQLMCTHSRPPVQMRTEDVWAS